MSASAPATPCGLTAATAAGHRDGHRRARSHRNAGRAPGGGHRHRRRHRRSWNRRHARSSRHRDGRRCTGHRGMFRGRLRRASKQTAEDGRGCSRSSSSRSSSSRSSSSTRRGARKIRLSPRHRIEPISSALAIHAVAATVLTAVLAAVLTAVLATVGAPGGSVPADRHISRGVDFFACFCGCQLIE